MHCSVWERETQLSQEGVAIEADSLYKAFEQVKDGRKERGKRYPLALLLTFVMWGKLAGETTIHGMVDWVKERQEELKEQLAWPKRFPGNSTYSYALARCDAQDVVEAIAHVMLNARAVEQCGSEPARLPAEGAAGERLVSTAMDGKTLRGTPGHRSEEQLRAWMREKGSLTRLYRRDMAGKRCAKFGRVRR